MRVLVAEDNEVARLLLNKVLRDQGFEVLMASDGTKALEILDEENAPELAILDWMMPGLDGLQVCRKIRDTARLVSMYVIILSAKGQNEDVISGLDAGANDYIKKPFNAEELQARVRVGARVVELQVRLSERVKELEEASEHIRTLQGILPICMGCHKIRSDDDYWQSLEKYIESHSDAHFSHGYCPECARKYYPEQYEE